MSIYLVTAIAVFIYMCVWFAVSLIVKRNDIADIAWGLGFVVISVVSASYSNWQNASVILLGVVTVWGFRLAWHIFSRLKGRPEDFRYAAWRAEWKNFVLRSFLQIYMLQGFLMYVISLPIQAVAALPISNSLLYVGVLVSVWEVGFYIETTADRELKEFLAKPENKGKLMTLGLWQLSRHPNYFGESLQWIGIGTYAFLLTGNYLALLGPAVITFFLRYVSGVPMLEKKYMQRADFREYAKKTSIFIPWFPKK